MKTMAEVLGRHTVIDDTVDGIPEGYMACNWSACEFFVAADDDEHWRESFATHQADMLTAAGFGLVQAVRAEVRYEAAAAALDGLRTSAPSDIDAISFMSGFAQEARASVVRGEG